MGTMKESYEQMEMKRLAAQRKKEKAQAIKDKERVRQQVRTGFMSDNIIPLEHRRHDLLARHFLLYAPYIVSLQGSHIGVSSVTLSVLHQSCRSTGGQPLDSGFYV